VYTAAETIPVIQQQIEQTENNISLLLGKPPAGVIRGRGLTQQELPPSIPAGLPSALLDRRPDIRQAEQNLIAANAQIGVAKAAYFPQVSLTGFLGGQSTQLASLFSGPHSAWNFTPQVTQPIFTAGRIKSGVRLAEAGRDSALSQYDKAIQTAFTEVSNALILTKECGKVECSRSRWSQRYGTGNASPTCATGAVWIRSSMRSTPTGTFFRPKSPCRRSS